MLIVSDMSGKLVAFKPYDFNMFLFQLNDNEDLLEKLFKKIITKPKSLTDAKTFVTFGELEQDLPQLALLIQISLFIYHPQNETEAHAILLKNNKRWVNVEYLIGTVNAMFFLKYITRLNFKYPKSLVVLLAKEVAEAFNSFRKVARSKSLGDLKKVFERIYEVYPTALYKIADIEDLTNIDGAISLDEEAMMWSFFMRNMEHAESFMCDYDSIYASPLSPRQTIGKFLGDNLISINEAVGFLKYLYWGSAIKCLSAAQVTKDTYLLKYFISIMNDVAFFQKKVSELSMSSNIMAYFSINQTADEPNFYVIIYDKHKKVLQTNGRLFPTAGPNWRSLFKASIM